jgi:23S rRNA (guanosine2251-2'-O)-methyltransferase
MVRSGSGSGSGKKSGGKRQGGTPGRRAPESGQEGAAPRDGKSGRRDSESWQQRNTRKRDDASPPAAGKGKTAPKGPGPSGRPAPRGRGRQFAAAPVLLATVGNELLYGRNAVLEALRAGRPAKRLLLAEGIRDDERVEEMIGIAEDRGVQVDRVPKELISDATRGANHQGAVLDASPYPYAELSEVIETPGTVLVLDHLQDPQNFGTLLRAAEAAGVAGVIIPEDRAVEITPAVVNASAGAVEHLRVAAVPNLPRALEELKASGRWVLGLAGEDDAVELFTADVPTPAALVVGAEGTGLGRRVRSMCDLLVSLPMTGRVASLNAATAGSIALYDLLRRERAGATD